MLPSPSPFDAVVFDLFGTIVKWSPERLPVIETGGRRVPSTIPLLEPILRRVFGDDLVLATWMESYFAVLREIEVERGLDAVEITCHERFERTVRRHRSLGAAEAAAVAEELTRAHMAGVRSVTAAPAPFADAVRRVAATFRAGLLSNFDDSRTGREVVADTGLETCFETIVISADMGVRKPHPRIFRHVADELGLDPARVLYVGDTPREDVVGARSVGMPVVWLSEGRGEYPSDLPEPDFTLPDVTGLPALLGLP